MVAVAPDIQVSFHECIIRGENLFLVFLHISLAREIELWQLACNNYDLPSWTRPCVSWLNSRVNTRTKLWLWQPARKECMVETVVLTNFRYERFFQFLENTIFSLASRTFSLLSGIFPSIPNSFWGSPPPQLRYNFYQLRYNFFAGSLSEYQKKRESLRQKALLPVYYLNNDKSAVPRKRSF